MGSAINTFEQDGIDEEFYDEYVTEIRDYDGALLPIEEHPSYAAQYPDEAAAIVR